MPRPAIRRPLAALVGAGVVVALAAAPASAHIDPDPPAIQAGKQATVGFTVEHGCGTSPTTKLEFQVPESVTDAQGIPVAGFTASTAGRVVTFEGGTVPADEEQPFQLRFTAPATAGEVQIKIIQTCEQGEIDWIEVEEEGQPEPEHPAPVIKVTEGAPTADDLKPAEDGPSADNEAAPTTTVAGGTGSSTTAGGSSATSTSVLQPVEGSGKQDPVEEDSKSNAPLFAGIAAFAVIVGGGGLLYLRWAKQNKTGRAGDGA